MNGGWLRNGVRIMCEKIPLRFFYGVNKAMRKSVVLLRENAIVFKFM